MLGIGRSAPLTGGYAFQRLGTFISLWWAPVPQVCPAR